MTTEPSPPAGFEEAPGEEVADEWKRRVEAEYRSASLAASVTLQLIQSGAPPDLIRDGLQVVDDELTHSELAWQVAMAAGAQQPPRVDPDALVLGGDGDGIAALALSVARYFCIGETVAVPLFRMLRRHAAVPLAQRALDAILRDEGRHRQFGWDVLDWSLSVDDRLAATVAHRLPAMLGEVRRAYGSQPEAPPLAAEVARWGLASPSAYAEVLEGALEREVVPRFGARGILEAGAAVSSTG